MPGHRIYYVPPRMVGSIENWSGKDQPDGASWLLDHAASLGLNALWFSPLGQPTSVEKISHGEMRSGSYYAQRDPFRLGDEFSAGKGAAEDLLHLKHFTQKAAEKGMRVYADLVCNHVAADHDLVAGEDKDIRVIESEAQGALTKLYAEDGSLIGMKWPAPGGDQEYFFKFKRNEDFGLRIGGPAEDPWSDVAHINYASPEARRFFIFCDSAQKGYFKQVIDWHMDAGFTDFRCDAAYLIPPDCWQSLIAHAQSRKPDTVFMAETLTTETDKVADMRKATQTDAAGQTRPAFDLGMLSLYWWNFLDEWLPKHEVPRLNAMSKFGGAGAPDNHDTENTIAGAARKAFNGAAQADRHIADISLRDYAVAVLTGNSSYVQMGYEFCNEKQNHVFKGQVTPEDFTHLRKNRMGTDLDISAGMRLVNDLHESMDVKNCRVAFRDCREMADGAILRLALDYVDVDSGQVKISSVLLLNRRPEEGAVRLPEDARRALTDAGMLAADMNKNSFEINDISVFHTPLSARDGMAPAAKKTAAPRPPQR